MLDKEIQRDQEVQLPLLKSQEQKQSAPCTQHHVGVGKTPKPPLRPDSWTPLYPDPR